MQLIPVLDLARGAAVLARGGVRAQYAPVESVLAPGAPGDSLALIQAYRDRLGIRECYLADLDAIQGGDVQRGRVTELARTGAILLVDAGVSSVNAARGVLALGAEQVVVGLETLPAFADLASIVAALGPERVVFSLDLRLGRPLVHPENREGANASPAVLASRAEAAGVTTLLVLDIGRVGTGGGVDLSLLALLRGQLSSQRLLAGGGVGGRAELERLRDAGCDGALVATAFHTGRLDQVDVAALAAAPDQSSARTSR